MSAERYTAVFTGLFADKKPGEYLYLTMGEEPRGPGDGYTLISGRPPYEKMGREVPFEGFPEGCKGLVLETYRELWGLGR